jgi:TrmH family RNA methyltransferase
VETPQGVLGVFDRPERRERGPAKRTSGGDTTLEEGAGDTRSGHIMVAAGVQDPANLGSMIRSARATGIRELLSTRGTVDPYHHRALRASMGATFRLRVQPELGLDELLEELSRSGRRTLALSSHRGIPLSSLDPDEPSAIVFGSEGHGLPPELEAALDLHVRIPMEPGVESLAVPAAAAVAFYWLYLRNGL